MIFKELRTPVFLVDLSRFKANCNRMYEKADRIGLDFSPHVKTHKTIEGAAYQRNDRLIGITVSTLAEAWDFAENDFQKITYAFPVTEDKLPEILDIALVIESLRIVADQPETIDAIQNFGKKHDFIFEVFLKINSGANRAGRDQNSDVLIDLAKKMHDASHIDWIGILSHAGHTYNGKNADEIKALAKSEQEKLTEIISLLNENGLDPEVVSLGDTPGCSLADSFGPATELRPGNYTFYDRTQSDIGSCSPDDIAGFVLSRVIARYPERNTLLIDAGALALSKDLGATHVRTDSTYGGILEDDNLKLVKLSQEHGLITSDEKIDFEKYPVGSFLTIIPNHSCLTAALHDHYVILNNITDRTILDTWKPVRGW